MRVKIKFYNLFHSILPVLLVLTISSIDKAVDPRYGRAFLFFHNYLTIIILAPLLPIMSVLNKSYGIFILAFLFICFGILLLTALHLKPIIIGRLKVGFK